MRVVFCLGLLAACGQAVSTKSAAFDGDLDAPNRAIAEPIAPPVVPRPVAPPGKGLRSGTIERAKLVAVLDSGPGAFLRQLEVTPRLDGQRFVGWQLVQILDHQGPLVDIDLVPGDVLLAVNGKPLSRPDQLQTVWDSLRTANTVVAQLWRGNATFEIEFSIEPKVATSPSGS